MAKRPTILINIASPIIIRNFFLVPDSVFSYLEKEGYRVVLVVPRPALERVRVEYEDGTRVFVEPVDVSWKRTFPQKAYRFIATYCNFTDTAKSFAKTGTNIKRRPSGGKAYLYFLKEGISRTLGKWNWFRNSALPRIDDVVHRERPYRHLFDRHKPDIVFLPDFHSVQENELLREARRQGVRTIGGPGSWDHLVKIYEPLKLDTILVWNEANKHEARDLQDYAEEDIVVTGSPYYDCAVQSELFLPREEFCKRVRFDPAKKIILFAGGGYNATDEGDVLDIIVRAIESGEIRTPAHVLLRPYPGQKSDRAKFGPHEGRPNLFIDWIETTRLFCQGSAWYPTKDDIVHFMNCLYHADVVLASYSSISIEASAFGKPNININFDGYQDRPFEQSLKRAAESTHLRYMLDTGGVVQADDRDMLIDYLNTFFEDPNANKENIAALKDKMCWRVDGKAGKRIMEAIHSLI